jgi:hypothetical protein
MAFGLEERNRGLRMLVDEPVEDRGDLPSAFITYRGARELRKRVRATFRELAVGVDPGVINER